MSAPSTATGEVKLLSLVVCYRKSPMGTRGEPGEAFILAQAYDVGSFSFLYRGTVKQFLTFSSRTMAAGTPPGNRASVKHQEYIAHSVCRYACRGRLRG